MIKALFFKLSIVLTVVLVLLIAAIFAMPSALRWGGEKWLRDQGLEAAIERVDLDLSEGWLVVQGAHGKAPDGGGFQLAQLRITWRWSPLWNRELRIAGIEIDGLQIDATRGADGAWRVAGLSVPVAGAQTAAPSPGAATEPSPWRYRLGEVHIADLRACYRDPSTAAQDDPLQSGFADVCARWDDLTWRGEVVAGPQSPEADRQLPWEVNGSLRWQGVEVVAQDAQQPRAAFKGLTVDGLHAQTDGSVGAERVTLRGLRLADPLHRAHLPEWFTLAELELGEFGVVRGELLQLQAVRAQNATLRQTQGPHTGQPMAGIEALALEALRIEGLGGQRNVTLQQATASGISALQRQAPADGTPASIATLQTVSVAGLAMPDPTQLRIDRLHLETPKLWFARSAAGQWEVVDWLAAPTTQDVPAQDEARHPLQLVVGELRIDGGGAVTLDDQKVAPPYRETVGGIRVTVERLDNSAPNQASPLTVEAGIGEYGKLALSGEVKPFAPRLDLKLSGTLSGVDLAPATSYARDTLQQNIRQGSLDAELKIAIADGRLDSTVELELQKLELSPMSEKELAGSAEQELGIPLNAALSLLRDSDDAIRLSLPIAGEVGSPDVSVRNVLGKVMGKAIKSAIVAYYSPFGLLKLVGAVLDLATGLSFEPVAFAVGDAALPAAAHQPLGELAKLLRERPQVRLVLCGEATRSDFERLFPAPPAVNPAPAAQPAAAEENAAPAIPPTPSQATPAAREPNDEQAKALWELAARRGQAVKAYLVKQGDVEPKRLIVCNPEPVLGDESTPRVRISI